MSDTLTEEQRIMNLQSAYDLKDNDRHKVTLEFFKDMTEFNLIPFWHLKKRHKAEELEKKWIAPAYYPYNHS